MDRIHAGGPRGYPVAVTTARQQMATECVQADHQQHVEQQVLEMEAEGAIPPQGPAERIGQHHQWLPAADCWVLVTPQGQGAECVS